MAYPAGGPTDTMARVATQGLGAGLGQSVVIENVAGAGGRLATKDVARAAPDGYTMLVGGSNEYAITPALYKNLDYNPVKDFAPVAAMAIESNAIVVNPAVPVHSLAELARYAKDHPGKLTSGATVGIVPQLSLEYFRVRMGVDIVFVPYKGAAPVLADCLRQPDSDRLERQIRAAAADPRRQAARARGFQRRALARTSRRADVPRERNGGFPDGNLVRLAGASGDAAGRDRQAQRRRKRTAEGARDSGRDHQARPRIRARSARKDTPAVLADEVRMWKAVVDEAGVHLE